MPSNTNSSGLTSRVVSGLPSCLSKLSNLFHFIFEVFDSKDGFTSSSIKLRNASGCISRLVTPALANVDFN